MAWIKRNLYFLIGGGIALALLGGAGFYLFTQNQRNNELTAKLDETYGVLNQLNQQPILPGNNKVDNIKIAKEQLQQIHGFIKRAGKFFAPVAPIPDSETVTDEAFAAQLRNTIEQMQRAATAASVTLPPHYDFSFSAIKSKISFAPGSLHPLAAQLGEVKTICEILFAAKINALDSVRRVRVSPDDKEMADYTDLPSITNDLAVLTPFELTFRCFSGELAEVLSGFAYSPYGFIVKAVAIEPSAAPAADAVPGAYVPPAAAQPRMAGPEAMLMMPGMPAPPAAAPNAYVPPAPTVARSGLPTVINERPLRVSLLLEVVKLKKAAN
ncbi:MAG: Amuc_1100 family pilus-like protein [Verrucomicrobia bacterium]|nr:Amuc_1100 family pilus-like protein [Verrucomicrobiota bacterium]